MSEWQVAISIGQLIGTVGALVWFTKGLKSDLSKLTDESNKKMEEITEKHYRLREEIAGNYLRRDEWLSHHNKLEAKLDKRLDEIESLLREKK